MLGFEGVVVNLLGAGIAPEARVRWAPCQRLRGRRFQCLGGAHDLGRNRSGTHQSCANWSHVRLNTVHILANSDHM